MYLYCLLWWTKFEHLLETREVTETIVAALLVLSHRLGRASLAMVRRMDAAACIQVLGLMQRPPDKATSEEARQVHLYSLGVVSAKAGGKPPPESKERI